MLLCTNQFLLNVTESNVCNVVLQSIKVQHMCNAVNVSSSYITQVSTTSENILCPSLNCNKFNNI